MKPTLENAKDKYLWCVANHECKNLMGRLVFYLSTFETKKILELWAERDDIKLEMPWGIYDGQSGVRRYFLSEVGDRSDPATQPKMRGTLIARNTGSEVLVVADDRTSAQGLFVSFGSETRVDPKTGEPEARWVPCKYGVDFLYENGAWKIWHLHRYTYLDTPFETSWLESPQPDYSDKTPNADRPPNVPPYVWSAESIYPVDQPVLPKPYAVFPNVAPGNVD